MAGAVGIVGFGFLVDASHVHFLLPPWELIPFVGQDVQPTSDDVVRVLRFFASG